MLTLPPLPDDVLEVGARGGLERLEERPVELPRPAVLPQVPFLGGLRVLKVDDDAERLRAPVRDLCKDTIE